MSLQAQLKADFGKDLPISGGLGQTVLDPIKVMTADRELASVTMLDVMRCIYGSLGWHWLVLQWDIASAETGHIEKVTARVKHAKGTVVITEQRSLYFDVSAVKDRTVGRHTFPIVRLPLPTRMNLPRQIGWFYFDGLIDNTTVDRGLGVSVAYSAPHAKMTIFVYDKGLGDSIQTDPDGCAKLEFEQAVLEFESVSRDAIVVHEHEERGVRIRLYETEGVMHAVAMAPFNEYFFKMRLTQEDSHEKFLVDCAWQTISTFALLVGQRHGNS